MGRRHRAKAAKAKAAARRTWFTIDGRLVENLRPYDSNAINTALINFNIDCWAPAELSTGGRR